MTLVTVVTKEHSSDNSDKKNVLIKFNVNVLPETYITSYVTVVTLVTEMTKVTLVTVVTVVRVMRVVKKKVLSLFFLFYF